jgi:hypothetical protein
MERTLQMVKKEPATHTDSTQQWSERLLSNSQLFCGRDETGRRGWFFRVDITGLYPRRVGPFPTRAEARERFEDLLAEIILEPLLALQNDLAGGAQGRYVIEGVPTLTGRKTGR